MSAGVGVVLKVPVSAKTKKMMPKIATLTHTPTMIVRSFLASIFFFLILDL